MCVFLVRFGYFRFELCLNMFLMCDIFCLGLWVWVLRLSVWVNRCFLGLWGFDLCGGVVVGFVRVLVCWYDFSGVLLWVC